MKLRELLQEKYTMKQKSMKRKNSDENTGDSLNDKKGTAISTLMKNAEKSAESILRSVGSTLKKLKTEVPDLKLSIKDDSVYADAGDRDFEVRFEIDSRTVDGGKTYKTLSMYINDRRHGDYIEDFKADNVSYVKNIISKWRKDAGNAANDFIDDVV